MSNRQKLYSAHLPCDGDDDDDADYAEGEAKAAVGWQSKVFGFGYWWMPCIRQSTALGRSPVDRQDYLVLGLLYLDSPPSPHGLLSSVVRRPTCARSLGSARWLNFGGLLTARWLAGCAHEWP